MNQSLKTCIIRIDNLKSKDERDDTFDDAEADTLYDSAIERPLEPEWTQSPFLKLFYDFLLSIFHIPRCHSSHN